MGKLRRQMDRLAAALANSPASPSTGEAVDEVLQQFKDEREAVGDERLDGRAEDEAIFPSRVDVVAPPPEGEPDVLMGDMVWFWEERSGGALEMHAAVLRNRMRSSGLWNLTVFCHGRAPVLTLQRTDVRYSEKPKAGHWTLRKREFLQEG